VSAIRTLIVDDEPLARDRLRGLLAADPEVQLVGECQNGREAHDALLDREVDLAFMDIQMPEVDGMEALAGIPPERLPAVVFVTAYDRYALKAFELRALDYLLKPFDPDRFREALSRAKERIRKDRREDLGTELVEALKALRTSPRRPERLMIKDSGRITFLRVDEIDFIQAAGNYVCLNSSGRSHTLRETMADMEGQLDPARFVRIHRSAIVNIDRIKELQPLFGGDYLVLLQDGTELTLSRSFRQRLKDALGRPL
jgi:two-component system, LytTR family, response regulator